MAGMSKGKGKVTYTVDKDTAALLKKMENFPQVAARIMLGLSARSRFILRSMLLSKQYLKFENYIEEGKTELYSKSGRKRMISAKLSKDATKLRISSFSLNLFERGRKGYKDKPEYRGILTGRLAREVEGQLSAWGEMYADKILNSVM